MGLETMDGFCQVSARLSGSWHIKWSQQFSADFGGSLLVLPDFGGSQRASVIQGVSLGTIGVCMRVLVGLGGS